MAIAATLMPPKRPRGARGGNPNRPSQRSRRDRGLPSELDSPAEGSTAERPPDPVGPPPGPSVPPSSDRTGKKYVAYHHHGPSSICQSHAEGSSRRAALGGIIIIEA